MEGSRSSNTAVRITDVPIRPEHKMTKAQVKLEVEHEGFTQTRVHDDLPRQHLIIFTKR